MARSAADLRSEIARRQVHVYELAPVVGLHPARLGQVLNERAPLTPELAARIQRALDQTDDRTAR
jgi:plasmid maintenance system antidote protein VapI